jgi:gamma-glutamyltranspeptidase/glutathione hydrolase
VAVAAALSVVEPWFSSALGGGTWGIYYDAANHDLTSLDGVGITGGKATLDDYRERIDAPGIHHAIVPGAWDAWMLWLDRYGRLDLDAVLAPAIRLAREGRAVSDEMAFWLRMREEEIAKLPDTAAIYAPDGKVAKKGDVIMQTAMAATFEALAAAWGEGAATSRAAAAQAARDSFYRGPIAEALVAFSDEHDGYFTPADFAGFAAQIVTPITIDYGDGIAVYECPPNSQGITMLMALNILKGLDLGSMDPASADAIHLQVEAIKLAFADRYRYIGDPARVDIPVAELLSDAHAAEMREMIAMDTVLEWRAEVSRAGSAPHHTTTFHTVDQWGTAAAVTTSLGAQFLVVGDTGIHINERMGFLSLEPGNVNELAPGFKVRHTSCPYVAFRDGRLFMLGGNTGVDTQPQGQVQQFLGVVAWGKTAQEAVSQPRFVTTAFPSTTEPYEAENTLQMEAGFRGSVVADLRARGHDIDLGDGRFGSANMIVLRDGGAEIGAEPRSSTAAGAVIPAGS